MRLLASSLLLLGALPAQAQGPPPVEPPKETLWAFGLEVRMPIIRGQPATFNPDVGIGVGVHFHRILRHWFALRVAVDYDRIFSRRQIPIPDLGIDVSRSQNLTSTSFLVQPTFRWSRRWLTLHFSVGLGAYIAFWNNAEVEEAKKVDARAFIPGGRLESGVTFRLHRSFALGLAFGYDFRRSDDTVPDPRQVGGPRLKVFDDQMAVSLRLDYLF
jgi:hypothetical protein